MQENQRNNRKKLPGIRLSPDTFQLKMIAVLSMVCSHIYRCLLAGHGEFLFLDMIGRISFPVFCFVLVEGFCHTKNRKAYLMRLWAGAVVSEIPFDLAFFGKIYTSDCQNVLFTMLIGMLTLTVMERCSRRFRFIPAVAGMAAAWFLKVDYGFYGIWLIIACYLFRGMKREASMMLAGSYVASVALYGWIQLFSLFSLPLTRGYNGQKGKGLKYFFYFFYPVHLLVLTMARFLIN